MTVIPFKQPDKPPPSEDPLYFITLYPHGSVIDDPNNDEIDRRAACEALFDHAFYALSDHEAAHALIALTDERSLTFHQKDSFETEAQHEWLARRLDDVYETCTGRPRFRPGIFARLRAFFFHLFNKDPTQ